MEYLKICAKEEITKIGRYYEKSRNWYSEKLLIIHSKTPQRNNIEIAVFDIVFHNETVGGVFDLMLGLGFAAYFKCLA